MTAAVQIGLALALGTCWGLLVKDQWVRFQERRWWKRQRRSLDAHRDGMEMLRQIRRL